MKNNDLADSKSAQDGLKFGQDPAKIAARRLQDLPKTILKSFMLHHLLFRLRFWSVLAPNWAPFAPPSLGCPKRLQNRLQKRLEIMLPQDSLQDRTEMAPDTPQSAPRDPGSAPKTTPIPPLTTSRALGITPRTSRQPPSQPNTSQDPLKSFDIVEL